MARAFTGWHMTAIICKFMTNQWQRSIQSS